MRQRPGKPNPVHPPPDSKYAKSLLPRRPGSSSRQNRDTCTSDRPTFFRTCWMLIPVSESPIVSIATTTPKLPPLYSRRSREKSCPIRMCGTSSRNMPDTPSWGIPAIRRPNGGSAQAPTGKEHWPRSSSCFLQKIPGLFRKPSGTECDNFQISEICF